MVLLHGGGTSYLGVLPTAKKIAEKYHVVLLAYDGFNPSEPETEFRSVAYEAGCIEDYIIENYSGKVDILYGLSYGCRTLMQVLEDDRLEITTTIADGMSLRDYPDIKSDFWKEVYLFFFTGSFNESMKLGIIGNLFPLIFNKVVYGYTAEALPELDMRAFQKKHKQEYEAMVKRTPSVGGVKDNMFAAVMYMACYGFSYYKADPKNITIDVFDGMIDALCKSDMMKRFYQGKNCFDPKEIDKYVRASLRSKKREYPMDWVFDFSYDLSVPEYYVTHRECGVCKIGQQEHLEFLTPHMCVMDYPTIEYKGGKLLRTKTLGAGGDCCDFHVVKGEG